MARATTARRGQPSASRVARASTGCMGRQSARAVPTHRTTPLIPGTTRVWRVIGVAPRSPGGATRARVRLAGQAIGCARRARCNGRTTARGLQEAGVCTSATRATTSASGTAGRARRAVRGSVLPDSKGGRAPSTQTACATPNASTRANQRFIRHGHRRHQTATRAHGRASPDTRRWRQTTGCSGCTSVFHPTRATRDQLKPWPWSCESRSRAHRGCWSIRRVRKHLCPRGAVNEGARGERIRRDPSKAPCPGCTNTRGRPGSRAD